MELLEFLHQREVASKTAVTVCSDHGELLGDWGLLLKSCFLEVAIRSLFLTDPQVDVKDFVVCGALILAPMALQNHFGLLTMRCRVPSMGALVTIFTRCPSRSLFLMRMSRSPCNEHRFSLLPRLARFRSPYLLIIVRFPEKVLPALCLPSNCPCSEGSICVGSYWSSLVLQ